MDTRDELTETYGTLPRARRRIEFPPEEDRDVPGYRAIFFFDPDRFRIEVVHWPGDPLAG